MQKTADRHEKSFVENGYEIVPDVLSAGECDSYLARLRIAEPTVGSRCLLENAWCQELSNRLRRNAVLSAILPIDYAAVQCTYFEKSTASNWLVPFHQDLSIPVAERVDAPELSGWSKKEGSIHVNAPSDLLGQLVAVRLHLDPCGADDGPLRVIPGSHRFSRIEDAAAVDLRKKHSELACLSARGGALAMRPLLLHASSKSKGSGRRRVLQFLFGPRTIHYGLRWRRAV